MTTTATSIHPSNGAAADTTGTMTAIKGLNTAMTTATTQQSNIKTDNLQTDEFLFPAADVKHFIGGLNFHTTEDQVQAHFERFGVVKEVTIMRDNANGRSRGFGFVTMAEPSSKPRIQAEKEHIVGGQSITVSPYAEQHELKRGGTDSVVLRRKVFVGGVNPALGQEVLDNYFSKYGALDDAQVIKYPDGKSRGFGFVVFKEASACQQVLQQKTHNITPRDQVEVKPCLSRVKAARQFPYAAVGSYGAMSYGGSYDGYSPASYGYGANYIMPYGGAYGAQNQTAPWQDASQYQSSEASPYQAAAAAGYDSYAGYYGWTGYSPQGGATPNPYAGTVAASTGDQRASPAAAVAGGVPARREQYSHGATVSAAAAGVRGMAAVSVNPYGNSAAAGRPSAAAAATQVYNPVRRSAAAGPSVISTGYGGGGGVRRPQPY